MTDWIVFWSVIAIALAVDFTVSRRSGSRRAGLWSAIWIGLGLSFGAWIALRHGADAGVTYVTAYLLEESLSVDNLFVFILILRSPVSARPAAAGAVLGDRQRACDARGDRRRRRAGARARPLGDLFARRAAGLRRVSHAARGGAADPAGGEGLCTVLELARPGHTHPPGTGGAALSRAARGRWMATPMLVALAVIETTDLLFAVDSIPAVFAVTRDPFLVYTSNIFALLGLRSLYFLLAGVIRKLRFLRIGLAVMLVLAAAKLALGGMVGSPPLASLAAIVVIFGAAIGASLLFPGKPAMKSCSHLDQINDVKPSSTGARNASRRATNGWSCACASNAATSAAATARRAGTPPRISTPPAIR